MNRVYKRANQNTAARRYQDKKKKDVKSKLQSLEVGDRVLVRKWTPRKGRGELKSFWERKAYIVEVYIVIDSDGLVYTVEEQEKRPSKSKTIHINNIMSCHNFPHKNQCSTTKEDTGSPRPKKINILAITKRQAVVMKKVKL